MMNNQVIMNQVFMKAFYKLLIVAALQPYSIIYTSVIYYAIYASKPLNHSIHGLFAFLRYCQFRYYLVCFFSRGNDLIHQFFIVFTASSNNDGNSAFFCQQFHYAFPNSFSTTGDNNNFIFVLFRKRRKIIPDYAKYFVVIGSQ